MRDTAGNKPSRRSLRRSVCRSPLSIPPLDRELELHDSESAGVFSFLEGLFLARGPASGGGIAAFDAKGSEFYVSGVYVAMGSLGELRRG